MISPESKLFQQSPMKLQMPTIPLPGIEGGQASRPNPFSGIRRAGAAKREQNFLKFQQKHQSPAGGEPGAQAGTLFGSMRQAKQ